VETKPQVRRIVSNLNLSKGDADVRKVLQEVGGEVNDEDLKRVVNALKGKPLHEVQNSI